jgi:hypothetical protein
MDERAIEFMKTQGTEAETRAAWEAPGVYSLLVIRSSAIKWWGPIGSSCSMSSRQRGTRRVCGEGASDARGDGGYQEQA